MLRFGVIGYGYWGPNIVRNLRSLEGCQVVGICDQTPAARKRIAAAHPGIPVYSDSHELIKSPEVDAGIFVKGAARPGSFVAVQVTGCRGYDLVGTKVSC